MRKIIIILGVLGSFFVSCKKESLTTRENIDQQMLKWSDANSPGFAISILENDTLFYSKGFGLLNIELNKQITPNSIFNIGSVSKSVTAACLASLINQNKLNLNDSLSEFFPNIHPKIATATVKQLLNHTSGIRDNESFGQLIESKGIDAQTGFFIGTDKDNWDLLEPQTNINFPHGSTYLYNNMGYWLLGQIVEVISQEPLEDFAQREFFTPLGMTNTSFGKTSNKNIALGYHAHNPNEKPSQIDLSSNSYGDGGVHSSSSDMVIWFNEIAQGKVFGLNFWKPMKTKGLLNNNTEIEYGGGLKIKKTNKGIVYSHGGIVPGYQSMVKAFPKQKIVIAVMTNQTQIDASAIVSAIEEAMQLKAEKPEIITLTETEAKKYIGNFQQTSGSEIGLIRHIIKKGNDFFYHRPNSVDTQIYPVGSDEFIMPFGNQQANIKIATDPISNKRQLIFKGNDGEPDRIYNEIIDEKTTNVSLLDLSKMIGKYKSEETQLIWEISLEQEKLYMDVITFKSQLNVVSKDIFSMDGKFTIEFKYDKQKNVTSFTLSFGKAKNIYFHKLKTK